MKLKHIRQSNIRIYDNLFDNCLDFYVEKYSWEKIIDLISLKQDIAIVPLMMMGDDNPSFVLDRLKEKYHSELKWDEISSVAWLVNRDKKSSIKKRTKYIENQFLLAKIKYLLVDVINSLIDTDNFDNLMNNNRNEYEKFVSHSMSDQMGDNTQILGYVLFKWIESFFKVFIKISKKDSEYAYDTYGFHPELYRIYITNSLQDFIEIATILVRQEIDRKYNEYQKKFTFSYFGIRTTTDNLEKKIQPIIDAIKEFSVWDSKLLKRYLTSKEGCLAGFKYKNHQYAALSGVTISYENEIRKFLLDKYGIELVRLSNDVRYYFTNSQYITYHDFKKWFSKEKKDSKKYHRMFSCCEKKLLVIVYSLRNSVRDYKLYVTKEPCPMCVTAIEDAETKYRVSIKIRFATDKKTNPIDESRFKKLAKKISKS